MYVWKNGRRMEFVKVGVVKICSYGSRFILIAVLCVALFEKGRILI